MNIKILSRNPNLYSTKRLMEAAKKRKHDVQVIDPLKCDLVIEKRNPNIYYKSNYILDT
ncbi:MAG: 30S ribosomal protein S6--L-glutamate ligase, partial [Psychroflexus sp.]